MADIAIYDFIGATSGPAKTRLPANARGALIGSSSMQQNNGVASTSIIAGSVAGSWSGPVPVARALSPRFQSTNWRDAANSRGHSGANYGYSGLTIESLDPYIAEIIANASKYDFVVAQLGANNLNNGEPAKDIAAKLATSVDRLAAAGPLVILEGLGPRSTAGSVNNDSAVALGNALYRNRMQLNRAALEVADARPRVALYDPSAVLCDPASPIQQAKTGYLRDGLHLSGIGALAKALDFSTFLSRYIPSPASYLPIAPDSVLNLFSNGMLTGTGGVNGGSVTGTAPDQTSLRRISGTATGVTSVRLAPDGGNAVRSVITNISGDSIHRLSFNPTPGTGGDPGPSIPVSGMVGKWVRASATIYVESGAEYLTHLRFTAGCRASSAGSTLEGTSWAIGALDSVLTPANGRTFYVETEPMLVPATTSHISLEAFAFTSGTGDFVFETSAPALREVADPR